MDEVADNTKGRLLRSRTHFGNILDQIKKRPAICPHSQPKQALPGKKVVSIKKVPGRSSLGKVSAKKAMSKKQVKGTTRKDNVALARKFAALSMEKPHAVTHACNRYQAMTKAQLHAELHRNNVKVTGSKEYLVMRAICMMRLRRMR